MFADLHIHMLLSGSDWKAAIAGHQPEPNDILIRNRLSAYQTAGISFLRDGGDRFGVCLRSLLSAVQQSLHHGFNRGAISHIAGANKPDKLGLF